MKRGLVKKRCPKCNGNIYLERDYFGWYEQCLQCGHTCYLDTIVDIAEQVGDKSKLGQAEGSALEKIIN